MLEPCKLLSRSVTLLRITLLIYKLGAVLQPALQGCQKVR